MTTALILAGHGSHISPNTAGLVWTLVDQLRAMNVADEVTAAFWKEMPSFHTVFDSLSATDITVVPLFTAQGYFTQTVIPAEMGLTGAVTLRDGKTIRYTRTLSEHPYLAQMARQRVEDALKNISAESTAVAVIGHSTRRNPESRKATEAQAEAIRALGLVDEVVAVYLDDSPAIADVYTMTTAPNIIAVPYFLAAGSHTMIDVPRELGFDPLPSEQDLAAGISRFINGREVIYTQPVGIGDDLRDAILELAREAGAPLKPPCEGSVWDCFPKGHYQVKKRKDGLGQRDLFLDWANRSKTGRPAIWGQLWITRDDVRHFADRDVDSTQRIDNPAELRRVIRENPFRPLATSDDLPRGWHVPVGEIPIYAIFETIYPGVFASFLSRLAHIQNGTSHESLRTVFAETLARQIGQYRQLETLTENQKQAVVEHVCGKCVLHPLWFQPQSAAPKMPCHEPCNFWLSAAMKALEVNEKEQPE